MICLYPADCTVQRISNDSESPINFRDARDEADQFSAQAFNNMQALLKEYLFPCATVDLCSA